MKIACFDSHTTSIQVAYSYQKYLTGSPDFTTSEVEWVNDFALFFRESAGASRAPTYSYLMFVTIGKKKQKKKNESERKTGHIYLCIVMYFVSTESS